MPAEPSQHRLFPLFADLRGRTVLVVGGGAVARRKVEALFGTGARVVVGAPELDAQVARWRDEGRIEHIAGAFRADWLDGVWLAIAATGDADVNRAVAEAGEARRTWVNVVDDAALARVHLPARVERGPLQVAISSGGGAPMLARLVRERIETELDESIGALATFLSRHRARIRQRWPDAAARRRAFAALLSGPLASLLRGRRHIEAERLFDAALAPDPRETHARGSVVLVGAGPGDPGLLTLRALRALNEADVIVLGRDVGEPALAPARRDAHRIHAHDQPLAAVMDAAASGARVVYLYRPQAAASCQAIVQACARDAISCRRVPGVVDFRQ